MIFSAANTGKEINTGITARIAAEENLNCPQTILVFQNIIKLTIHLVLNVKAY